MEAGPDIDKRKDSTQDSNNRARSLSEEQRGAIFSEGA